MNKRARAIYQKAVIAYDSPTAALEALSEQLDALEQERDEYGKAVARISYALLLLDAEPCYREVRKALDTIPEEMWGVMLERYGDAALEGGKDEC